MRTPHIFLSVLLCLGLAACGSSTSESDEATSGGEATPAQEHPSLPPDLHAFHDVLAPVWHSDAGEGRAQAACENAQSFVQLSANVEDGQALRDASRHLAAICGSAESAAIEEALGSVHQAFHDVMEARDPDHDDSMEEASAPTAEAPSDEAVVDGAEAPSAS